MKGMFFFQNFEQVMKSSKALNESNTPRSENT